MKLDIRKPGNTPLIKARGLFGIKNLFIKDETKHTTHTFKDRLAYDMISTLIKSLESGKQPKRTTFASISYGNTAIAMGYYSNLLNSKAKEKVANCIIFIPNDLEKRHFGPDSSGRKISGKDVIEKISKTCEVIKLDLGKERYKTTKLKKIAKETGFLEGGFVDVTEGLNRPTYQDIFIEIVNQLGKEPDYVIVPFGAGILCNEIMDVINHNNYKTKLVAVSVGRKESIATMLYGPYWVDVRQLEQNGQAKSKHKKYPLIVYNVQDKEILDAMQIVDLSLEPSGAAGFAILQRLRKINQKFDPDRHSVVVIATGNGLLNF